MFSGGALGGFRPGKAMAVESPVILDGGVEAEDALIGAANHDADEFAGDFYGITF